MTTSEIKDGIMMAFQALWANKLRAILTILGVLIGVTSVMGMVSIIQGLNDSMAGQIQSLGSNVIYVERNDPVFRDLTEEERKRPDITFEDALALKDFCPSIGAVSPQNYYSHPEGNKVKYRNNEARRPSFAGVLPDYEIVNNTFVTEGRFFTESDVHFKAYVCVIGYDVREALFAETEDPIGKQITVNGDKLSVIGVMEKRSSIIFEGSQNNFVFIPYDTFIKIHPEEIALWLLVRPKTPELIDRAIDEIEDVMRRRRGVPADKPNNFAIYTQEDLMDIYRKITTAIYGVMILISSIGLFVGGVGVMNIMLVTVTERTREIGIRKAIGAKRRNILWQFLIEAMTLTGVGGVLGIIIGILIGLIVKVATPLPASISLFWVILSFGFAVGVGLIFGIYPAYRAAKLDPIVALRYE